MTASSFLIRSAVALAFAATLSAPIHAATPEVGTQPYPGTLVLNVDATDLSQQIFRIRMSIPVQAGPLTLLYPQWLPGNHGPSGPLTQLAGLKLTANGKPVVWTRDLVNVYAFHMTVPEGATTLEAEYQYLSPLDASQGRTTMTDDILGVQWISMALYPAGYNQSKITFQPNLVLPAGWKFGTALETDKMDGNTIHFKPVDLRNLVDSPLFAGRYFKRIDLAPGAKVPVNINIVADNAEELETTPEQIEVHRKMVQQAIKLFGSQHYDHYDFLFSISDEFSGIGLEHHQSSENGVKTGYFKEWKKNEAGRDLLAHEYTHSWDGKFRRPAGQDVPNLNTPLQNSLLWVYEGQTQYWGNVLATRSGMISPAVTRDKMAATAAHYDNVRGRDWRAMQDTVNDPIINARRPLGWANWQRAEDYYNEGMLIWLDVDTRIRELSGEKRSLNDFAHSFFSVNDGSHTPAHYTFDDVVSYLNKVQPYDWATFLRTRVEDIQTKAPLDGLARAGWKLVYTDTPSDVWKSGEERSKSTDFSYSLGFTVKADGGITNVEWDGLAFKAGLAANSSIVAINNKAYKPELLKTAIKDAKTGKAPITLLVKKGPVYRTVALDYHDGLRYPHLERIPGTKDRLEAIMKPLK
jgi:predicted metalloprotease with PDZ domain